MLFYFGFNALWLAPFFYSNPLVRMGMSFFIYVYFIYAHSLHASNWGLKQRVSVLYSEHFATPRWYVALGNSVSINPIMECKLTRYKFKSLLCLNYPTNTTAKMFWHPFISHIRYTFRLTISAIIRRYYKNIRCKVDKTEGEAPLCNIIQTWNNYIYTKEQWNVTTSQCVNR